MTFCAFGLADDQRVAAALGNDEHKLERYPRATGAPFVFLGRVHIRQRNRDPPQGRPWRELSVAMANSNLAGMRKPWNKREKREEN